MSQPARDTPRPFQPPVAQRDIKAEVIHCVGGVRIPPCGVPVSVSSRFPAAVMTPDFRNAFTSAQMRLSLILARRRSIKAVCEISSKQLRMSASSTQ
jgi:hypothetical protein